MGAHRVPDDEVLVVEAAVALYELGQTGSAGVLVGVVAGSVLLVGVVLRDPQVPGRELSPLDRIGVGLVKGQHVLARHQLVGDGLTELVLLVRVADLPVPR